MHWWGPVELPPHIGRPTSILLHGSLKNVHSVIQQIFIEHLLCAGIVGRACNTVVNKTEQSTTLYSWSFHFSGSHVIIFSSFIVCMLNPQGPEINPILVEYVINKLLFIGHINISFNLHYYPKRSIYIHTLISITFHCSGLERSVNLAKTTKSMS